MKLIEQLGGYEKAKAFLNATSFTIDELIMMQRSGLRTQHVEKALLEYRRQHNIFEIGDYFCYESKYLSNDPLDGDAYKKLNQLDSIDFECGFVESTLKRGGIIRHATDEEIKAGKRLEVNDAS
ncbi:MULTISPECIES: hypothetical protein [Acinetobacter]|uniref:hypothetical protein n=1 Tax=Acinetobacter TaxID=469 RepID=UPI0025C3E199|nr:hypothetical protein [Acinetobacter sp. UBA3025]